MPPAERDELDDEKNVPRGETSSGDDVFLESCPFFVYGEEELPVPKVNEVSLKTRKLSSSMISAGIKMSKTTKRSGGSKKSGVREAEAKKVRKELDGRELPLLSKDGEKKDTKEVKSEDTKVVETEKSGEVRTENSEEAKRERKKEEVIVTDLTGSEAVEPKAGRKIKVLRSAIKSYCFIRYTLFNYLKDEYEPKNGSVLTEKMKLVLADPLQNTCSARGQPGSAHVVPPKRNMEEVVRLVGSVMASWAHWHVSCSDSWFHH